MIVVNLDVMMAKRKMSPLPTIGESGYHPGQPVHSEKQQGQGRPFLHAGGHLRRPGLPAGRHSGVRAGRRGGTMTARRTAPPRQAGLICRPPALLSFPPRSSAPPGREWYWSSCWGGSLCPSAPGISGDPPLEPGRSRKMGPSVLRDIFCGLYPAAVSLPICPGRPPGPLRYLITPFRILLLMLTR